VQLADVTSHNYVMRTYQYKMARRVNSNVSTSAVSCAEKFVTIDSQELQIVPGTTTVRRRRVLLRFQTVKTVKILRQTVICARLRH